MKHVLDVESPVYQEKVKLCWELICLLARIKGYPPTADHATHPHRYSNSMALKNG